MGTPKAGWQQKVAIEIQSTSISTAGTFASGTMGIESSKHLIPVLNRDFSFNPGLAFIEERQAFGTSDIRKEERKLGNKLPSVTLEFPANAYNMPVMMWLLLQSGVSEGAAAAYVKTGIPYTSPECEVWASLADAVTGSLASGNNEAIHGAIIRSLTLNSEQGGQLKASAEFVGGSYSNTFNDGTAMTLAPSTQAGLLHQNMNVELDGNTIYIPSISITITNNATSTFYNSTSVLKHLLQDLEITGEIVVPRDSGTAAEDDEAQITDLLAGDDKTFSVYWGQDPAASAGQFAFHFGILIKDKEKVIEDEVGTRIPFEYVRDTQTLSMSAADGIDRSVP